MKDKNVRELVYIICYKLIIVVCAITATRCCIQIGGIGNIIAGIFLIIMAIADILWILADIVGFLYGRQTAKETIENLTKELKYGVIENSVELGEKSIKREDIEKK